MSCNSCAKPFTLLRKEKGCPGCGFSYCSKCLDNKIFLQRNNAETKVCLKCKQDAQKSNEKKPIEPPDAYYKRIGAMSNTLGPEGSSSRVSNTLGPEGSSNMVNSKDKEIQERLHKLKESKREETSEEAISRRLQKIKGDVPSTSDGELLDRLAKLRGVPVTTLQSKPLLVTADARSEQEQIEDLLKQYHDQTNMDTKYNSEFNDLVTNMETRLQHLKGNKGPSVPTKAKPEDDISEDEEDTVKKIIEKLKTEALLDDDISPSANDELPFCEICNEDATMRCVGCQYLFCKRCFLEHRDDDDGCDKYEPYTPPNRTSV